MPVRHCSQCAHDRNPLFQPARSSNSLKQHEQFVGGGVQARGERGYGFAELLMRTA